MNLNKRIIIALIGLLIFSNVYAKSISAQKRPIAKINGVNINDGQEKLSISILTDKEVKRNSYRMINPYRIVIDISPAELSIKEKFIEINKGGVKNISFHIKPKNVIRSVIELNKIVVYDIATKEGRTVVNISKEKEISVAEIQKPVPAAESMPSKAVPTETKVEAQVTPAAPAVTSTVKEVKKVAQTKTEPAVQAKLEETGETEEITEVKKVIKKKKLQKGSLDQLVTLELVNADLLSTLRAIAEDTGYNLIASKSVVGIVTLTLRDVQLRRALDAMLNMNGFSYVVEGNIIEVATSAELSSGDEQGKLITQSFPLNFAKADSIQTPLKAVLSKNGSIQIDARTNTIIVTDTMPKLRQAAAMIERLDTSIKQVMIEAKLIEVSATRESELGIKWQATKGAGTAAGTAPTGQYPEIDAGAESKAISVSSGFAGILQIGTIAGSHKIGLVLNALATSTDANILANPRITTLDNKTAKINITTEIPYLSAFNKETGIATYSSVTTGITLEVTPQVNPSGYITMKVKPTVSSVVSPGPPPVVDKRETETEVIVKDGDTLVIGGLLREEEITRLSKVPLLGDIPLLGFLFKDKYIQKSKKDLIIFITPHIL